jgi:hypothetical protein
MTSRRSVMAVAVTVLVALSGCVIDRGAPAIVIDNHRTTTISVTIEDTVNDPGHVSAAREPVAVPPGERYFISADDCQGTGAFATDDAGREIARVTDPLCPQDIWAFEADGTIHLDRD